MPRAYFSSTAFAVTFLFFTRLVGAASWRSVSSVAPRTLAFAFSTAGRSELLEAPGWGAWG